MCASLRRPRRAGNAPGSRGGSKGRRSARRPSTAGDGSGPPSSRDRGRGAPPRRHVRPCVGRDAPPRRSPRRACARTRRGRTRGSRIPVVVRAEEADDIRPDLREADVEAGELAGIRLLDQPDPRIVAGRTHAFEVRGSRSIVDHYDLVERARLPQRSRHRFTHEVAVVEVVDQAGCGQGGSAHVGVRRNFQVGRGVPA